MCAWYWGKGITMFDITSGFSQFLLLHSKFFLLLFSIIFWAVQLLLCRKIKQPFVRHLPQICIVLALVLAYLADRNVFGHLFGFYFGGDPRQDFNETAASMIVDLLASPLLLGTTSAWLLYHFPENSKKLLLTIPAGVLGLGIYQLLCAFIQRLVWLKANLILWGIMTAVFLLLEGMNAVVRQIRKRKKQK